MKKLLLMLLFCFTLSEAKALPKGFSYLLDKAPNIALEMRYFGSQNFIGDPIEGYLAPRAILSTKGANALQKVQKELEHFDLGLKVFDAYRPQKAVAHFVRWGRDLNDTKMKSIYYPNIEKRNLFKEGYIAKRSGHSRGSTVDLTIIDLNNGSELEMGSPFDFFGKESGVFYANITPTQRANRMLLHTIMLKHGFSAYAEEWWHFTLKNEPFKGRYFDFDVE